MKRTYFLFFFALVSTTFLCGQGMPPPMAPPPPPGLPIDGGLFILLISGAVYGVSKLRK